MTRMWRASAVSFVLALLGGEARAPFFVFRDDFDSLDSKRWVVSRWKAPGNSLLHGSQFLASQAWIENGHLVLRLVQMDDPGGTHVRSYGGEVGSRHRYGFGTYEWRARVGSTASTPFGRGEQVSGGITGLFNYDASGGALRTEIDIEAEGVRPNVMHSTAWTSASKKKTSAFPVTGMEQGFHIYKFVWHPNRVEYFVDGVLRSTHTALVPQEPAYVIMNHWGTNHEGFGGAATTDVARYLYVDWFQFTPANGL